MLRELWNSCGAWATLDAALDWLDCKHKTAESSGARLLQGSGAERDRSMTEGGFHTSRAMFGPPLCLWRCVCFGKSLPSGPVSASITWASYLPGKHSVEIRPNTTLPLVSGQMFLTPAQLSRGDQELHSSPQLQRQPCHHSARLQKLPQPLPDLP